MAEIGFLFSLQLGDRVKTDTDREWKGQVMKENESDYCNKAFELTADEKKRGLIQGSNIWGCLSVIRQKIQH